MYILYNSVTLVCERTILTERPPLVGEVSANFCGQKSVARSARRIPTTVISVFWTTQCFLLEDRIFHIHCPKHKIPLSQDSQCSGRI
jgi:hypothetical protein